MNSRLARFHKVAALAEKATLLRRLIAAVVAGPLAFILTQFVLGVAWGAGSSATIFSSVALAVAAAVAALTMKRAMAVVYGFLAAIWLLLEGLALLIGCIAASLS